MEYLRSIIFNVSHQGGSHQGRIGRNNFTAGPGLRLVDAEGLLTAQQSGWILSYTNWETIEHDNTYLDFKKSSLNDGAIKHFANALIRLVSKRNNVKVTMSKEEREVLGSTIFEEMTSKLGLKDENLFEGGYLMIKHKRENRSTPLPEVTKKLAEFARKGVMPPLLCTPTAMTHLARNNNLLHFEQNMNDNSVLFEPSLTFEDIPGVKNSTAVEEIDRDVANLSAQLSAIAFDQDCYMGDIQQLADRTVIDDVPEEDFNELRKKMNETMQEQRALVRDAFNAKNTLDDLKTKFNAEVVCKIQTITILEEKIRSQQEEDDEKTGRISSLQDQIDILNEEQQIEVDQLQEEIDNLRQERHALKKELDRSVKRENLDELEDELQDVRSRFEEAEQNERKALAKLVRLKQEEKLEVLQSKQEIMTLKAEQQSLKEERDGAIRELTDLKHTRAESEETIKDLTGKAQQLRDQLDDMRTQARGVARNSSSLSELIKDQEDLSLEHNADSEERVVFSPQKAPPKPKRRSKMTESDVQDIMFSHASPVTQVNIATMSNADASRLIPKMTSADKIRDFCKKINDAWDLCKASGNDFPEASFCQILRINLGSEAREVVDNLTSGNQAKVDEIVKALKDKLDKTPIEYLNEYNSATKQPTETHAQFSLRLKKLYKAGTGCDTISDSEGKILVEKFLSGLDLAEASALRLIADDTERGDCEKLAKRAARCYKPMDTTGVNVLKASEPNKQDTSDAAEKDAMPTKQESTSKKTSKFLGGMCWYCAIRGHSWRECFRRARQEPNWKPRGFYSPRPNEDVTEKQKANPPQ